MKINRKNVLFLIGCITSNASLIDDFFSLHKNKDVARKKLIETKYFISTLDPFIISLIKYITSAKNIYKFKVFRICREVFFESKSYEIEDKINNISFIIMKNKLFSNKNSRNGYRNGIEYDVNRFLYSNDDGQNVTEISSDKKIVEIFKEVSEIFMDTTNGLSKLIKANSNEVRKSELHKLYKEDMQ